jgi:phage/plasmid-like protein (TIGR03299 family)
MVREKEGNMPAGITKTDGMAYVGRRPWHGLGTYVEGQAMTSVQAIEAAGLDWEVVSEPVYRHKPLIYQTTQGLDARGRFEDGRFDQIEGKRAIIRQDTDEVFGIMSDGYTPVQNTTAFDLIDSVVGSGDATFHTVGSLFGGRRVWMLCKLQGDYKMDNGEKLESFILLDNSHDGTAALRMRLTSVRVVCSNTLGAATSSRAAFAARHTSGIMGRVSEARDLLGLNAAYMERLIEDANRIAEQAWSHAEMKDMTYKLLDLDPARSMDMQHGIKAPAANKMFDLFYLGEGNRGETRWDALNAVTEYLDYSKGSRAIDSLDSTEDAVVSRRLQNSWLGSGGEQMRARAWSILNAPTSELVGV